MNELQALYLTLDLWVWLNENPLKGKNQYPLYFERNLNQFRDSCPLCEYYDVCTNGCPLAGKKNCKNYYAWLHAIDLEESVYNSEKIIKKIKTRIKKIDSYKKAGFNRNKDGFK